MQPTKSANHWTDVDTTLCDMRSALDTLDAVRIAIETGEMPGETAAGAVFGVQMLLNRVYKELRTACDAAFTESKGTPP